MNADDKIDLSFVEYLDGKFETFAKRIENNITQTVSPIKEDVEEVKTDLKGCRKAHGKRISKLETDYSKLNGCIKGKQIVQEDKTKKRGQWLKFWAPIVVALIALLQGLFLWWLTLKKS